MTTITVSEALKGELADVRDSKEEFGSLEDVVLHSLANPRSGAKALPGEDETLTEPIKVTDSTKRKVKMLRERLDYPDYDALIRDRIGAAQRDTGEGPIDVRPLPD